MKLELLSGQRVERNEEAETTEDEGRGDGPAPRASVSCMGSSEGSLLLGKECGALLIFQTALGVSPLIYGLFSGLAELWGFAFPLLP